MQGRSIITNAILFLSLLFFVVPKAYALTPPNFPTCLNPQTEANIVWPTGIHGIPGDSAEHTGSDSVFLLSDSTVLQCFCSINGDGIQTNWWKIAALSDDEIQTLMNQGWIKIPDGSLWGLDKAPYLAKNEAFFCAGGKGGGLPNPAGHGDGLSDGRSDGRSSGSVLSTFTGQVLGLANTGNIIFILSVISAGILMITAGLALNFKRRK